MGIINLRKKLIRRINNIENNEILEEMYRLIENEEADLSVYELSASQKNVIEEAQEQLKNGRFLTDEQADKEINEWLDE